MLFNKIQEREMLNSVQSIKAGITKAVQEAIKLGSGSSRIAFEYNDPKHGLTVIKVAKNEKGFAQNNTELNILKDDYSNLVPKLYDYDTSSRLSIKYGV